MILLGSPGDAFQSIAPRLNEPHLTEYLGYRPVPLSGTSAEGFFQRQTIAQSSGRRYLKAVVVQSNLNARLVKKISVTVCIDDHFAYCIWWKLVPFSANQPFDFS